MLIASPWLRDCHAGMQFMMTRNDRGDLAQESLGVPEPARRFFGDEAKTAARSRQSESLSEQMSLLP